MNLDQKVTSWLLQKEEWQPKKAFEQLNEKNRIDKTTKQSPQGK